MPSQTKISRFSLMGLLLISLTACFTTNNQNSEIALEFVEGEVFIRLERGVSYQDLLELAEDLEFEIDRPLGNGYVVKVPKDAEPLWITQLNSVLIIDEARYNVFGYDYSISINEPEPTVENNELTITVNYSGCDDGHTFKLEHPQTFSNNLNIWLFKSTPDQDCNAYFQSEYTFSIPRLVQLASRVIIEDPYGNEVQLWPEVVPEESD
ncbi:MAG: hypothetical protein JJ966_04740 [Balneolaceae bacterium]|nr:hypothetical protein [Balneolaceae bacterium]